MFKAGIAESICFYLQLGSLILSKQAVLADLGYFAACFL